MPADDIRIPLASTATARLLDGGDRALRRGVDAGDLLRVRAGVFAPRREWDDTGADAHAIARVRAVVATRRGPVVLSHESAALLHGLPIARPWPRHVSITEPPESNRRSKRGVVVHRSPMTDDDIDVVDGMAVTSLVRTLADLARDASLVDSVVAMDAAIDRRGPRVTAPEIDEAIAAGGIRGRRRATAALSRTDAGSMSPLESCGRLAAVALGFPTPITQVAVRVADGGTRYLDLGWPEYGIGAEADGRVKYVEDATTTVWAEKRREALLADAGVRLARFTWADCLDLARFEMRLRAVGLPRRPRPIPRSVLELPWPA